jgi:hypothetical protein
MTIKQALSGFYADNDFEDDGITQGSIAWLKVGPFKAPIPNPEARKRLCGFTM